MEERDLAAGLVHAGDQRVHLVALAEAFGALIVAVGGQSARRMKEGTPPSNSTSIAAIVHFRDGAAVTTEPLRPARRRRTGLLDGVAFQLS